MDPKKKTLLVGVVAAFVLFVTTLGTLATVYLNSLDDAVVHGPAVTPGQVVPPGPAVTPGQIVPPGPAAPPVVPVSGYDVSTHGALSEGYDLTPDPVGSPAWVLQGGPIGLDHVYLPPHYLTRGNHCVRWLAGLKISTAGKYEFRLAVKCAGYLWLNDDPAWEQQRVGEVQNGYIVTEFSREFAAGIVAVEAVLSNQNTAGEGYELRWRGPGITVPADSPDGYAPISTAVIFPPADWRTRLKSPVAPPPVPPGPQPAADLILPPLIGPDYQSPDLPDGFMSAKLFEPWREDISAKAVDAKSAAYIASLGNVHLHPGFGAGNNGIPYQILAVATPAIAVTFDVEHESDAGPWPIPMPPVVEGGGDPDKGDVHWTGFDAKTSTLYEIYQLRQKKSDGKWYGYQGTRWVLSKAWDQRPAAWTSADAAGLPITPGLVRYQEVASGEITHALRCTVGRTQRGYCGFARHWASSSDDTNLLPMGAIIRIKASVDESKFGPQARVVVRAGKKYGFIVADNGSAGFLFVTGAPDKRWDDNDLAGLRNLRQDSFEVIQTGQIKR